MWRQWPGPSAENGNAVLLVIIGITVLLFSSLSYIRQTSLSTTVQNLRAINSGSALAYQSSINNLLLSQQAFIKSARAVINAPLWSCLNDPEYDCQVAGDQDFYLFSDEQNPATDVAFVDMSADHGLTEQFTPCTGGASFPSTTCPYRYELKWRRTCIGAASPCNSPSIFITGRLRIAGLSLLKLYVGSRDFDIDLQVR